MKTSRTKQSARIFQRRIVRTSALLALVIAVLVLSGGGRSASAHVNAGKAGSRYAQMSACIAMGGTFIDKGSGIAVCEYPDGSSCVIDFNIDLSICFWKDKADSGPGSNGTIRDVRAPGTVIVSFESDQGAANPAIDPATPVEPVIVDDIEAAPPAETPTGEPVDDAVTPSDASSDPVVDPLPPVDDGTVVDPSTIDTTVVMEPGAVDAAPAEPVGGTIDIDSVNVDAGVLVFEEEPAE